MIKEIFPGIPISLGLDTSHTTVCYCVCGCTPQDPKNDDNTDDHDDEGK